MSNPVENGNNNASKPNMILLIAVIILAVCVGVAAIIAVVHTIRADNPTEPTESTVDAAAQAEAARNTIAITIGDHQLNAVTVNYFYMDTVNQFCNQFSYYIYYIMDVSKPLNEQKCTLDETMTWAEYLMDMAEENMKSTYLLCDLAKEAGFTLSEDELAYKNNMMESIRQAAVQYKYESADAYLADIFGYGADLESYSVYYEMTLLADAYYAHYAENLTYEDEDLREFEAKDPTQYNTYSYAYYYLDANKFLTGGVEDSDGKVTYTEEQKKAAREAAKVAAEALKGTKCEDLDAFKAMILGMDINSSLDSVSVKEMNDQFLAKIDESFGKWIVEEGRTVGDVTAIAKTTTDAEKNEIVEGYYIVLYTGLNENKVFMKDVRHILITFKDDNGKTYSDGVTSFTDAQKAAAKEKMDAIVALWEAGEMTEEAFAALATEKTEDPGSKATGGLYTNIYPGMMVEPFENWCFNETRVAGNYEIVETVYGYHLMYFVGTSEMTYRDFMISSQLRSEELKKWHTDLVESAVLTELCLDYCKMDLVLSGG